MSTRTQIIGIIAVLLVLVLIIELVRRRQLRTGYSILWLLAGLAAVVLILFKGLLAILSDLMGIASSGSLLFSAGIAAAMLISLGQSIALTRLWRQGKELALEQALLQWRVRTLEARLEEERESALAALKSEAILAEEALRGMEQSIPAGEEMSARPELEQQNRHTNSA